MPKRPLIAFIFEGADNKSGAIYLQRWKDKSIHLYYYTLIMANMQTLQVGGQVACLTRTLAATCQVWMDETN
mgnify:CR=1